MVAAKEGNASDTPLEAMTYGALMRSVRGLGVPLGGCERSKRDDDSRQPKRR